MKGLVRLLTPSKRDASVGEQQVGGRRRKLDCPVRILRSREMVLLVLYFGCNRRIVTVDGDPCANRPVGGMKDLSSPKGSRPNWPVG